MGLMVGGKIWIPCEVKPGPFSDERMVLIRSDSGEWFGFVNAQWLKRKTEEGQDFVLGTISKISGNEFEARIPGHAPDSGMFVGRTERAVRSDPLPA